MNIFAIDIDPLRSAIQLHDKHVVKMILESAQLLCTTRRLFGATDPELYKQCFQNHPCTKWVRESSQNYTWLYKHLEALCCEYTYRYGRIHKVASMLKMLSYHPVELKNLGLTKFALAMPEEYKVEDPIQSYRNYYLGKKIQGKFWTNRQHELDDWLFYNLDDNQFKRK
jgi:hypothetical protein